MHCPKINDCKEKVTKSWFTTYCKTVFHLLCPYIDFPVNPKPERKLPREWMEEDKNGQN